MSKMLAYRIVPSVFVVVHGKDNPTDAEWADYLTYYVQEATSPDKILVVSNGGGPTTSQRAAMNEQLEEQPTVSICTDSRVVRGVVTAVSWFNSKVRAFRREDIEHALRYLKLTEEETLFALDTVKELLSELEPEQASS